MTDQPGWAAPGPEPTAAPDPAAYGSSAYGSAPAPRPAGPPAPNASGWGQPEPGAAAPQPPASGWASPQHGGATAQPAWGTPTPGWGPPPPGPPRAAKPGVIPLRPLGVGELLDGAISTLRGQPKPMLGLSLVVAIVTQLVSVPLTWLFMRGRGSIDLSLDADRPPDPGAELAVFATSMSASAVQLAVTLIAVLFLTGILTVVVSRAVLGQSISVGEAWNQAAPRILPLFGVTFIVFLQALLVAAVAIGPGILLALVGAPAAAVAFALILGVPLFFCGVIYIYVLLALAPSAAVLERQGVMASLLRSRALVKGAWLRTFWILFLVNLIAYALTVALSAPFMIVGLLAAGVAGDGESFNMFGVLPLVVTAIGTILGSTITWPFTAAATVLIYVDRRIRREGLDLELARAAGVAPAGYRGWSPTPGAPTGSSYGG